VPTGDLAERLVLTEEIGEQTYNKFVTRRLYGDKSPYILPTFRGYFMLSCWKISKPNASQIQSFEIPFKNLLTIYLLMWMLGLRNMCCICNAVKDNFLYQTLQNSSSSYHPHPYGVDESLMVWWVR
jgi:hypothetical protein